MKAGELLDLLDTPRNRVFLTPLGRAYVAGDPNARFRQTGIETPPTGGCAGCASGPSPGAGISWLALLGCLALWTRRRARA